MSLDFAQLRRDFGIRLKHAREDAGYAAGKDFAQAIGWGAPKVCKIETGRQKTTTPEDLETWLQICRTPPEAAEELRELLEQIGHVARTEKHQRHVLRQARKLPLPIPDEPTAFRIRALGVRTVPDLLRTPDYARFLATEQDRAELHAESEQQRKQHDAEVETAQLSYRQKVLHESWRRMEFLVHIDALRAAAVPPEIMRAQRHRVLSCLESRTVRVGILPPNALVRSPDFQITDTIAYVDQPGGRRIAHGTAGCDREMDRLWKLAAEKEQARSLLT